MQEPRVLQQVIETARIEIQSLKDQNQTNQFTIEVLDRSLSQAQASAEQAHAMAKEAHAVAKEAQAMAKEAQVQALALVGGDRMEVKAARAKVEQVQAEARAMVEEMQAKADEKAQVEKAEHEAAQAQMQSHISHLRRSSVCHMQKQHRSCLKATLSTIVPVIAHTAPCP